MNSGGIAILDAHVHIHECFDIANFLDCTWQNFRAQAESLDAASAFDGVVLLTESYGVNYFSNLRNVARSEPPVLTRWLVNETDEPMSLQLADAAGKQLLVIAGRQIVTSERLEILALGLLEEIEDKLPIHEVIERVQAAGALCVLPWGFGKWTGNRGRKVRDLIANHPGENFFLGDNSGRLAIWPAPAEYQMAASSGIGMLSGTDPLPWPDQVNTAGRFGTLLNRRLDPRSPFADLRRYLFEEQGVTRPFGALESVLPFLQHQVGMQFKKRAR
ncbi:MAG TPA: hypothetical protein PKK10_04545 [Woeseiaceae bacterium]|nr:hypothetical protein [Woeseiaceae bacterium]